MEESAVNSSSTVDTCQEKITSQERQELSNKGIKICEIIDELTEFINERSDSPDHYTLFFSPGRDDNHNKTDYHKHGYLPENGLFALKKDINMFHTFKIICKLHCVPSSATLYISADDNSIHIPIKTVKIDPVTHTFSFFDCPFPVSCFRENFLMDFSYKPSKNPVDFSVLRLKDPLGIQHTIWDKMEEKGKKMEEKGKKMEEKGKKMEKLVKIIQKGKKMEKCMSEVYSLLEKMLEEGDPCTATVLNRNDGLVREAKDLVEEFL